MSVELMMLAILCLPLLLLPSVIPSIRVFVSELAIHIRWPKYWCLSFSISNQMNLKRIAPYYGVVQSRTQLKQLSSSSTLLDHVPICHSFIAFLALPQEQELGRAILPVCHIWCIIRVTWVDTAKKKPRKLQATLAIRNRDQGYRA